MVALAYIDFMLFTFANNFLACFIIAFFAVALLNKNKRNQDTKGIEIRTYRRLVRLYSMKCYYIDRGYHGPGLRFVESEIIKNKKILSAIKKGNK